MTGGKYARWIDEDMADVLTREAAVQFIERNKDKPFFLYFATHDIHVPRVPQPPLRRQERLRRARRRDPGARLVASAGDRTRSSGSELDDNTLVIFTSDNGPVVDDGYADGAVRDLNGHTPAGPLRGGKYSIFEGGTRVPFIARWPGKVRPGRRPTR